MYYVAVPACLTGDSGDELERPQHPDGPQRAEVDAVVLLAAGRRSRRRGLVADGRGRPRCRVLRRQDGDVPEGADRRRYVTLLLHRKDKTNKILKYNISLSWRVV